MRYILILLLLPTFVFSQSSNPYPPEVEAVLKKAGKNRAELEKAITWFKKSDDPLKVKAVYFLIKNMDIHFSRNYYWADSASGKRIEYNELNYPDFASAVTAFDEIKSKVGKVKPVPYTYKDIDSIKADYLIENVEQAFQNWKLPQAQKLSFDEFCESLLPYRISTEPLQNWRKAYQEKFKWIGDSVQGKRNEDALNYFANDLKKWFINTWNTEQRKEPLPRLGPLQLLTRKKGNCDDIAGLQVFTLRSQGYPASLEYIPFWATTSGTHYFNSTIDENKKLLPFDVSTADVKINNFSREPSKVIRFTYAKQNNVLAAKYPENSIPPGFMRRLNYKDVTAEYWETGNLKIKLFNTTVKPELAFACVFNSAGWQPTWWGKVQADSVVFSNMSKGAVYLPMYYINGKIMAAGDPVALGYTNKLALTPDLQHKRSVTIREQEKYLKLRPGKKYELYYWDKNWKLAGVQKATEGSDSLQYTNVPKNALMLLIPEYSEGKERPFIITGKNEHLWF